MVKMLITNSRSSRSKEMPFRRCFVGNKHVAIVLASIKTLTKITIVTDFIEMIVPFVFKLTRMVRKGRITEKFQAKKPI